MKKSWHSNKFGSFAGYSVKHPPRISPRKRLDPLRLALDNHMTPGGQRQRGIHFAGDNNYMRRFLWLLRAPRWIREAV